MKATARLITGSVRARAQVVSNIAACARATEKTNISVYLRVNPVEPQQLVWLNPQYGIDYDIRTSKGLHWNII